MLLVIVSDSHGDTNALSLIRERHLLDADLLIHCGDSQLPANHPLLNEYLSVLGNCDFDKNLLKERIEPLTLGARLFITHGHLYDVKYSLTRLYYRARELDANIVCYGHSHCIGAEMVDGILFMNPGSVVLPRNTKEKTYALLEISETSFELSYHEVQSGKVLVKESFKR
ncbi:MULTISPECIES: metallophosphoesterase [Turicibacter]|jgi:phosphodiesterase family protein|uniref:Phosphoesterase n=2 Tax=Turicibacter sanguinis TaxID=154288 RepID=A0A173T8F7_9FIRM|nr:MULTISPECIES: metallophosphoesterase [Turicibacter]EFF65210.1 phosphodiesterase family protein [Turicibacter sanguinis PC909]EGC93271.1 phosphodiesterase family protein [Turicibacter sp. HGF1]MBP3903986.1 metallophosphoesterase [Turicibacter sp.]MCU7190946.1 metallophosphoesterase [Turicibacter sanguinis]MCU7197145.1 metallophosphoesterase [Turicibacter sanguinis]